MALRNDWIYGALATLLVLSPNYFGMANSDNNMHFSCQDKLNDCGKKLKQNYADNYNDKLSRQNCSILTDRACL